MIYSTLLPTTIVVIINNLSPELIFLFFPYALHFPHRNKLPLLLIIITYYTIIITTTN